MLDYQFTNLQWEIDYKLNIDKEILGQLLFDLKEYFPDLSTPLKDLYIFRNSSNQSSLVVDSKNVILRLSKNFEKNESLAVISILQGYIPNTSHNVKIKFKHFIKNTEEKEFDFHSKLSDNFGEIVTNSRLRSIGFEKIEKDSILFHNIQVRKDNLEILMNTIVVFNDPLVLETLYDKTIENLEYTKKTIETEFPLISL